MLILFLLFTAAPAWALDKCMTGSWVSGNHEGVNVEVLSEDQAVAYWYTYRFFDQAEQNWLVLVGDPAAMQAFDVHPSGRMRTEFEVGSGSLVQTVGDGLSFSFDFTLELDQVDFDGVVDPDVRTPWCLNELCEGTMTLTRLTQPIPCGE